MSRQIERLSPRAAYSVFSAQLFVSGALTVLICAFVAAALVGNQDLSSMQRWLLILFLFGFAIAGFGYGIWETRRQYRNLLAAADGENGFSRQQMSSEQQRLKLNLEIMMIADRLQIPDEQHGDLRAAYVIAEDLALRKIELDNQMPLHRHVVLASVPFDAAARREDKLHCVEVTFLVAPDLSAERVAAVFGKVEKVAANLREAGSKLTAQLTLALVTQLTASEEAALRAAVKKLFAESPVDADVLFMDFESLQTVFTAE